MAKASGTLVEHSQAGARGDEAPTAGGKSCNGGGMTRERTRRAGRNQPRLSRHRAGGRRRLLALDCAVQGQVGAQQSLVDGELFLRLSRERGCAAALADFPAQRRNSR